MPVRQLVAMLVTLTLLSPAMHAQGVYESVDPSAQTIRFWHQHGGAREAGLQAVVEAFNSSNPYGIRVVAEYQGSYTEVFQKMLLLVGTADAPNLVVAYQDQAAAYQFVDGLVDIRTFLNSPRWGYSAEDFADFFPGFIASDVHPVFDNQLLGFPPNRSIEVLYVNIDWLRELCADALPSSPEAFEALACAAAAQPFSKSVTGGASLGYELTLDASRLASWTFAFGGDIYDTVENRYTLDSDAAVAAMTFLQGLFARGCAAIVTERFGDQTNFGLGTTLFNVGSSSALPFYRSAVEAGADFDWSVAAIPHTTPEPVMNVYGASVSITRAASREAELATWLFVQYFTSPEAQASWARASNYFPVRASVAEGLAEYYVEAPAYAAAFELLRYGVSEPVAPGYAFVRDLIAAEMAAMVDGADVQRTLTRVNDEANRILAEQLADLD
jgi:multiple sugar transport system substrate-binding protein/sn-glycerol 3-phosphate transport system substrate-binding protein